MNVALDHLGFAARALAPGLAAMRDLGFAPTPPKPLLRRAPTGERVPLGQDSAHLVFEHGYVELTAVTDPASGNHLEPFLARYEGLHILALHADDPDDVRRRLLDCGLAATEPADAARAVEYGSLHGEARFRWFMLDAAELDGGLVCVVRNLRPDLVYQPEVQRHPNGARALRGVTVATLDLPRSVAAYEALTGEEPESIDGGVRFPLGQDTLTVLDCKRLHGAHRAAAPLGGAGLTGLAIEVESLEAAAVWLEERQIPWSHTDRGLEVGPAHAAGAVLELVGADD